MNRFTVRNIVCGLLVTAATTVFCLSMATFAATKPVRVILDTDGAFESSYTALVLALASSKPSPPINLVAVTTAPTGEGYCNNSNGYPNLKQDLLGNFSAAEGDVNGLTQKVLSIAQYSKAKIYSGCDDTIAVIPVPSEANDFGKPLPGTTFTSFRFQLPLGGKKAFEPCLSH